MPSDSMNLNTMQRAMVGPFAPYRNFDEALAVARAIRWARRRVCKRLHAGEVEAVTDEELMDLLDWFHRFPPEKFDPSVQDAIPLAREAWAIRTKKE